MTVIVPILIVDDRPANLAALEAVLSAPDHQLVMVVTLGYQAGAVDCITKPFDPTVLRFKVAVFSELYRQRAALASEAAELRGRDARLQQLVELREPKAPRYN